MKIKEFFKGIGNWINKNPVEFWILVFILLVASVCRLYKIDIYMTFLGDEGRDAIIVRRLLTEGHPPLIGPGTSIGNMYLGPLYYYMMAIPLLLANFNPVGPAIQVALLGVITVGFVWYVGRLWFGKIAGITAAIFFAISPTIILYSRSSWNPNIMPFFSLLTMYSVWKVWKEKKFQWLIVSAVAFAFVMQSHYLGILLLPTIFIFWFLTLLGLRSDKGWKPEIRKYVKNTITASVIFLGLMSPLFFFDVRHEWINTKALYTFLTVRQETVSIRPWNSLPKIPEIFNFLNSSVIAAKDKTGTSGASALLIAGLALTLLINYRAKRNFWIQGELLFLISWLGFGLIGLGLYKQNIYDHYFGFLFAVPLLLLGFIISKLWSGGKILKLLGIALLVYFMYLNLIKNPLQFSPNYQMQRSMHVAEKIINEAGGNVFNFAVLAERNYEDGYEYFLLRYGASPLSADTRNPDTISDQLFVACEMGEKKCDPTHSAKSEVAHFGMSKIDAQWTVDGVIIYKLLHVK